MDRHTIIGMAGHIDHGKTALIQALTGIETDTLKEEKLRGITIDIGFAYWQDHITIIDVPGHERFVKNMVAGVSTVDLFLLVIAADDGIMPQTVEHLEILKFFGVQNGIVAVNKSDLVEPDWLDLVIEETDAFMEKHDFRNIPVIPVSSVTGSGVDALRQVILERTGMARHNREERPFRLNIDRSFSSKGFGTIVTGTVLSAGIRSGDPLQLLPANKKTKVRGLQVHQHEAQEVYPGQRTAINLSGIDVEKLKRGHVLVEPGSLNTTKELLAEIKPVLDLKFRVRRYISVRLHIGTDEVRAKMNWFEEDAFQAGQERYHVRLKLERHTVAAPGDAILIRSLSPVTTLAGGRVLQINPPRLARTNDAWTDYFHALKDSDYATRLQAILEKSGFRSFTVEAFRRDLFLNWSDIEKAVQQLQKVKIISAFTYKGESHFVLNGKLEEALIRIEKAVADALKKEAYRPGFNTGEMKSLLIRENFSDPFLNRALQFAVNKKILQFDGERYSTEAMQRSRKRADLEKKIREHFLTARFSVADMNQLAQMMDTELPVIKRLTSDMAKEGDLISIRGKFYLHKEVFTELLGFLQDLFARQEELTIADVKNFTGSTRKWIVPLMEFLDGRNYTERDGDIRRKGSGLNVV